MTKKKHRIMNVLHRHPSKKLKREKLQKLKEKKEEKEMKRRKKKQQEAEEAAIPLIAPSSRVQMSAALSLLDEPEVQEIPPSLPVDLLRSMFASAAMTLAAPSFKALHKRLVSAGAVNNKAELQGNKFCIDMLSSSGHAAHHSFLSLVLFVAFCFPQDQLDPFLPLDLWLRILMFLPSHSLFNLLPLSRAFHALILSPQTWEGRQIVLSQLVPPVLAEEERLRSLGLRKTNKSSRDRAKQVVGLLAERIRRPSLTCFRELISVSLFLIRLSFFVVF